MKKHLDGFTIGDEVKIIGGHYNNGGVGQIGVIDELNPHVDKGDHRDHPYARVRMSDTTSWAVALDDLQHIPSPATDEEVAEAIRSILHTNN